MVAHTFNPQADLYEFKVSLVYKVRFYLKQTNKNNIKKQTEKHREGKSQWVKILFAKSNELSLTSRTYVLGGENQLP